MKNNVPPLSEWSFDRLNSLYELCGKSFRACAREVGCAPNTFIKYYNKKMESENNQLSGETEIEQHTSPEIQDAIQVIQNSGFFVTKKPLQRGYTFDLESDSDISIHKIGIVSDTHLGSRYQQLESLWKFYDLCNSEGIDTVLHAGDLSDGYNMYAGQVFELFVHGETAQAKYIIDNYPQIDGINTLLIGGNHDESFYRKYGSDICYNVSVQRPDMQYKGFYLANFNLNGISICLHHGDGSVAYARSYRPQKLALSKIEDKYTRTPDIFAIGHYHTSCILPDYVGIYTIQMPCFQAQTPSYMGKKGLNPDIGGIILEIEEQDGKMISSKTQYVSYAPKEDDY